MDHFRQFMDHMLLLMGTFNILFFKLASRGVGLFLTPFSKKFRPFLLLPQLFQFFGPALTLSTKLHLIWKKYKQMSNNEQKKAFTEDGWRWCAAHVSSRVRYVSISMNITFCFISDCLPLSRRDLCLDAVTYFTPHSDHLAINAVKMNK